VKFVSYTKDPRWVELSDERKREIIPVIFKRTIKTPKVFIPVILQVIFVTAFYMITPEFQYKSIIGFVVILISVKVAFLPMKKEQDKVFEDIITK